MQWYRPDNRKMPWKGSRDAYVVWLSEIILQQTRVEQGLPYFNRFVAKYPTIHRLAEANEDEVLKLWQGLGYYSRARNMLATAKKIVRELNGEIPKLYKQLIQLKGIGAYTAAAIASFAYNQPYAVVDGNVFRVLARYFGVKYAIDSTEGKKYFTRLANELIDKKNPALYNQAIMDFGAGHCKPSNPLCGQCPLSKKCIAFRKNSAAAYPVKTKKPGQRARYFNYLVIRNNGSFVLRQRNGNDIWKKLYEFPLIETKKDVPEQELIKTTPWGKIFRKNKFKINPVSSSCRQILTHQKIYARFWEIKASKQVMKKNGHFFVINRDLLTNFAYPKIIFDYLKEKSYI